MVLSRKRASIAVSRDARIQARAVEDGAAQIVDPAHAVEIQRHGALRNALRVVRLDFQGPLPATLQAGYLPSLAEG